MIKRFRSVLFIVFATLFMVQCQEGPFDLSNARVKDHHPQLQHLLDSLGVKGVILVVDPQAGVIYSNDLKNAHKGSLPASTFKIPNSIIAIETGVADPEKTVFVWDGSPRRLASWEQDMMLQEAFHRSCVPCYQQIAREIGAERMNHWLDLFDYGTMDVNDQNIDVFWLEGQSAISPYQQIDFISKFYYSMLPISVETHSIVKDLMIIESMDDWELSGKTGWAIRQDNNTGWFVGYVQTGGDVFFIATCIEPGEAFNMQMFNMVRKNISLEALRLLKIIR